MPGIFSRVPNIGTLRRKFIATGRKPLKQIYVMNFIPSVAVTKYGFIISGHQLFEIS